MTYQELIDNLSELEDDQLALPVMIDVDDEYYSIQSVRVQEKHDRLEDGYPYLVL